MFVEINLEVIYSPCWTILSHLQNRYTHAIIWANKYSVAESRNPTERGMPIQKSPLSISIETHPE